MARRVGRVAVISAHALALSHRHRFGSETLHVPHACRSTRCSIDVRRRELESQARDTSCSARCAE